jgi:serine/threonine protein kinase
MARESDDKLLDDHGSHELSQEIKDEISADFSVDGADAIQELRGASQEELLKTAQSVVQSKVEASKVIDGDVEDRIPKFDKQEIRLGFVVGRGGFGVVYDVDKIKIDTLSTRNGAGGSLTSNSFFSRLRNKTDDNQSEPIPELQSAGGSAFTAHVDRVNSEYAKANLSRDWIAGRSKRSKRKGSKFVLKRVKPDLIRSDKVNFLKGIVDLSIESKYLAALDHPNVISLCGISRMGPHDFLILEKLVETLTSRFKAWTRLDRQCKGITGAFVGSKKKREELLNIRLKAAHDIAAGVSYLHESGIIFRDLVSPKTCFLSCPERARPLRLEVYRIGSGRLDFNQYLIVVLVHDSNMKIPSIF